MASFEVGGAPDAVGAGRHQRSARAHGSGRALAWSRPPRRRLRSRSDHPARHRASRSSATFRLSAARSGRFATSVEQLVVGLAPVMGGAASRAKRSSRPAGHQASAARIAMCAHKPRSLRARTRPSATGGQWWRTQIVLLAAGAIRRRGSQARRRREGKADQRRLAAAVGAEEPERAAAGGLVVDAIEGGAVAEALDEAACEDGGGGGHASAGKPSGPGHIGCADRLRPSPHTFG